MFLQALSLTVLFSCSLSHTSYFPSLYSPVGHGGDQLMSGDFFTYRVPNYDMMWDNYLKVSEVPEEEWAGWKADTKVTFTMMDDGTGMSVMFTGLEEPIVYKFGVEDTYDLGDYGKGDPISGMIMLVSGVSKMRMDRTGPSSVVLTEHTEDPATFEIKNIVFFPHGVEVSSGSWCWT